MVGIRAFPCGLVATSFRSLKVYLLVEVSRSPPGWFFCKSEVVLSTKKLGVFVFFPVTFFPFVV